MSADDLNTSMVEQYRNDFLKEVEANVEDGNWVKMCMQCGVCSGSCTFGPHWEHPPQELFMLIRAGKREEVLTSNSVWMCTSCYSCIVRCPRDIPITHIMHGLASYAHRLGLAPKMNPTRKFSKIFWDNLVKTGRVNEMQLTIRLYLMNGLIEGIKTGFSMRNIGLGMLLTKRLNPFKIFGFGGCKGKKDIHRMLAKAKEIEDRRKGYAN